MSGVVLVTGAHGGLGQALTRAFASAGWRVAAAGHTTTPQPLPPGAAGYTVELRDSATIKRLMDDVHHHFGRLDVLVHNAGVAIDALVPKLSVAAWDQCLSVNLRGAFLCARAALGSMLHQADGHILLIGSHASCGSAGQAAYAAAKSGLIGLGTSLAREAGPRNVRVNTVWPGVLHTAMTAQLSPQRQEQLAAENLLGRWNDLEEVARFVAHLAETRNISGQVFQLDSRVSRWV